MDNSRKVVICGAGIAGIAGAYYLAEQASSAEITLIDKNQPLTFTSSKSGENFRDYWPHPSMEALSSHSIDLMLELQKQYGEDAFNMRFSGYHFVSHAAEKPIFSDDSTPDFSKRNFVETNPHLIQARYPYLDSAIQKSVFIRKAGNVDSISMANLMLQKAKSRGVKLVEGEITAIRKVGDNFRVKLASDQVIQADQVIIAAGPFLHHLGRMLGLNFPVSNTLQRKFIMPDPKGIIPKDMPFTIYTDGQYLNWTAEELAFLQSEPEMRWITEEFPGAIHIKPESGRIKLGWAFSKEVVEPQWEISKLPYFPQVVIKGASRFIPALSAYVDQMPGPVIEYGGYYTRTAENWPLIGDTEIDNIFVIGALAGFGTMTACAAGELCAKTILGHDLPWYAAFFSPNRYSNPLIQNELSNLSLDGQL